MTDIVKARAEDLDELSCVIADAFHDLPPSRWLIADETIRCRVFPGYFRLYLEDALARGVIHTTPDRAAAALWIPVSTSAPGPPDGYAERLTAATGPWTSRFTTFDEALDGRHPAGTRPHHHLALIGVRPDHQGRGIGTALLEFHHRDLDKAGMPAYLEAGSQQLRRLYSRHGYVDHGASIDLPRGPSLYPMWREPLTMPVLAKRTRGGRHAE